MIKILLVILLFLRLTAVVVAEQPEHDSSRWLPAMEAFNANDESDPPEKHGVLFVGSSSIRLWDLDKYFPELGAINRGFGGSQIADSVNFVETLVIKHQPRVVVLYAGDNDVAAGKSAEQVHADFQEFAYVVHAALPDTKIVYIAIKPSTARWRLAETMESANELISASCADSDYSEFVDIWRPMLEGNPGPPPDKWFRKDGLHLNPEGYALWTKLVGPHLDAH